MEQLLLFKKCKCKACKVILYWHENKDYCPKHYLRFLGSNKERRREQWLKKQKNPIYRIKNNLRDRIKDLLKNKKDYSSRIGCTGEELRAHLESKFYANISWENYGTVWHVDHIKPLSKFNLLDPNDLMKANHYTNLQPLLATDNIKKSNKYDSIQTM